MFSFDYHSPTKFVFGEQRETEVAKYVTEFGGSNVLVVYGGKSAERSGLIDRVEASLQEAGLQSHRFGGVIPNPTREVVEAGISLGREKAVDFVLAVGGGSTIDAAKAIAMGIPYDGYFWDFFEGTKPERVLPIGTILTISSAGSEGSPNAVITRSDTMEKVTMEHPELRPKFSILNPELSLSLSPFQTACGLTDIFSHALERYFTTTEDGELNDRLLEGIMLTVLELGPKVMLNPNDYGARANLMWAAMICNNDILGVGRRADWNTHLIEHVLSAKYNVIHAAGIAVLTPAWLDYVLEHSDDDRLVRWAERVFGLTRNEMDPKQTAKQGIEALKAFLKEIGMPRTLQELGIPVEDIPEIVRMVGYGEKGRGGFVRLTDQSVEEILRKTIRS